MTSWSWAASSSRGADHVRIGVRCQDAYRCSQIGSDSPVLVAVLADGAGSARMGGEGASLAVRTLSCGIHRWLHEHDGLPDANAFNAWIEKARARIEKAAAARSLQPRDFAATLMAIVSDGQSTSILHIGDGAAVGRCKGTGDWSVLSWPDLGEYAATTFFLTDAPRPRARFTESAVPLNAIAGFTDGIERLALDFSLREAHAPFFNEMIRPVDALESSGKNHDLSVMLKAYLSSNRLSERSGDDKTLILAARK